MSCVSLVRRLWLVAASAPLMAVAACGNYISPQDIHGLIGLSKDVDGGVRVTVNTCDLTLEEVRISGGREDLEPEQENPILGLLRPVEERTGDVAVNLSNPGADWEVEKAVELPDDPDRIFIVMAGVEERDSAVPQACATGAEIQALADGEMIVGNSEVVSSDEISYACR